MKELFDTLFGAIAGPLFLFLGLGMMYYMFSLLNVDMTPILSILIALSPIWLPLVFFYILFEQWLEFARAKFAYENGRVTLRIKLPQEVLKSPEAMESVFAQIHNPNGPDNLWQTYIDGKHPLISSFEFASIGGEVRFYANVPRKKVKNALESQLYAQYPGVEVVEEPIDYAGEVVWDPEKWDLMSFHIVKKDDEEFPIKTYIDYGMDKLPKEELKFEPMAPIIENLGKASRTDRMWVQILCKPHAKSNFKTGSLSATSTWEGRVMDKINEMMGRDSSRRASGEENEDRPMLTPVERDTIGAMQRNASKYAYEVGIRAMYIAEAGKFDGEMIGLLLKGFSQFDLLGRNGLGVRWRTDFDYNWFSDYSGAKKTAMKKRELEAYKARAYSPGDKKNKVDGAKVMSVEELATLYHIPGTSVVTPNLARIESTRKEAPANLPTG